MDDVLYNIVVALVAFTTLVLLEVVIAKVACHYHEYDWGIRLNWVVCLVYIVALAFIFR